jgi:hypothetical protein
MQLSTKTQIAKLTLSLLTLVSFIFLLGVLVIVLCTGLQINPFRETTSSLLASAFAGLIGVAAVLVLLNVATNVSLIADARIAELHIEARPGTLRRWAIVFFTTAFLLVSLIFAGTYISKERYLRVVRTEADEVLKTNQPLLNEISRLLASGKPEDYNRIGEIRSFLQSQRQDLPELTIIYSGNFSDKLAFYQAPTYFSYSDSEISRFTPEYFRCAKNLDCDYLTRFFSGEKVEVFQKYTLRDNQFYIYIPFTGNESRFVLLFERTNSYGKIGS